MNLDTRTLLSAAGAFLGAAVVAFVLGQSMGGGDAGAAELPFFEAPDPVVIPIEVPEGTEAGVFADALLDDIQAERELASELGVSYLAPGDGGYAEEVTTAGGGGGTDTTPDGDSTDGTIGTVEPLPGSGDPPPDERAVDLCAIEDIGTDACPDGVAGTVLLALRDVRLSGNAAINPPSPEEARPGSVACTLEDRDPDALVLGVVTSMPAIIEVRYRAGRWMGDSYEVEGSFEVTTTAAQEEPWNAWLADESASFSDPAGVIRHCITMPELPPRAGYSMFVDLTDKYDPSIGARAWPQRIDFDVTEGGLVPGEQRRPTTFLGYGIDDLRVGVTSTPEQSVSTVAVPDLTPGVCDTGGDDRAVIDREDGIRGTEITNNPIERAILDQPGYLWFRDHSRSVVHQLSLEEGTDYTLCIYWFNDGPSFDRRVIEISEATVLGTPEAWRPRLILHDLRNLFGELETVTVSAPGCPVAIIDDLVIDREGNWDWVGGPIELCRYDTGLTELDRGIRMGTAVVHSDGQSTGHRPWIRTNLNCDVAPCLLHLDDVAIVPLPAVPTERRLCGTGFGSGCDGDVPMRSAGDAVIRIIYDSTPGNGRTEWSFGDSTDVDITPAELGDTAQVDVDVEWELVDNARPDRGVRANVTVTADRPVSLRMEPTIVDVESDGLTGLPPDAVCFTSSAGAYEDPTFRELHTFSIEPLCLGRRYHLDVSGTGEDGSSVIVVPDRFGEPRPYEDVIVPPLWAGFEMTARVIAPVDGDNHSIELRPIRMAPQAIIPPTGTALDWSTTPDSRVESQLNGWVLRSTWGSINACGYTESGPLVIDSEHTRRGFVGQEQVIVTIEADIWRNYEVGGPFAECARAEVISSQRIHVALTMADLLDGVTLRSADGTLEVTLQMTTWRRTLIG